MKKLVYGSIIFASTAIIFVGCQKEDVQPNMSSITTEQSSGEKPSDNYAEKAYGSRRIFFDDHKGDVDGVNYGCNSSGGNCLDDVIVTPRLVTIINEIGGSGNTGVVISIVAKNLRGLEQIVDRDLLHQVLTGALTLNVRGRVNANETAYLLFKDGNQDIVSVQPVKM